MLLYEKKYWLKENRTFNTCSKWKNEEYKNDSLEINNSGYFFKIKVDNYKSKSIYIFIALLSLSLILFTL